jgi:hypothetical protein
MKHNILDGLQVMLAVIITTSLVVVNAAPITSNTASINRETPTKSKTVTPVKTQSAPVTTPVAPTPTKEVTWQDNPNHCDQDKQYIDATAPFGCIDKQSTVSVIETAPAASTQATAAQSTASGCQIYFSGDYYLDKIIAYESSGDSCVTNYLGCFGLLQACPGAPLRDACGGEPACQIEWFRVNKTNGRSWQQVWQHELDYGWW